MARKQLFSKGVLMELSKLQPKNNPLSNEEIKQVQEACENIAEKVKEQIEDYGFEPDSLADVYGSSNGFCPILDDLMPGSTSLRGTSKFVDHFLTCSVSRTALAKTIKEARQTGGGTRSARYGADLLKLLGHTQSDKTLTLAEAKKQLAATAAYKKMTKAKKKEAMKKLIEEYKKDTRKK